MLRSRWFAALRVTLFSALVALTCSAKLRADIHELSQGDRKSLDPGYTVNSGVNPSATERIVNNICNMFRRTSPMADMFPPYTDYLSHSFLSNSRMKGYYSQLDHNCIEEMTVHVVRDILQMCVMLDQCETQLQIFTRDPSPLLKEAPRSKQIEKTLASYNQIKSTSPVHAPTMPNVFLYPVAMLYPVFSRSNDAEVTFVLQTIPSAPTPYMLNKPIPNIEAASPSLTYSGKMSQQMMFRADERFNIQTTTSSTDPDGGD